MLITDVDVLKMDSEPYMVDSPAVLKRAKGTDGLVMGTQFAAALVDFVAVQVAAGHVIQLGSTDGTINGVFEVVGVIDGGTLTVSQVRNNPTDPAIPIAGASGLTWAVKTLTPQIQQTELELCYRLGLKPGKPDAAYAISEVQNIDAVKQVLTALLLSRVFGALCTASTDATLQVAYEKKRMGYEKQSERLLTMISIQLPA